MTYTRTKQICFIISFYFWLFTSLAFENPALNNETTLPTVHTKTNTISTPLRSVRLPNTTYPLNYYLHINCNIHAADFNFTGNVTIDIEIKTSTNEIVLHAKNLSDFKIMVRKLDSDELLTDLTYTYVDYVNFLIIYPIENYQAFEAGQKYRVEILFSGVMQERTIGFYWMEYTNKVTNRTNYVAATQSEPTYARLLFPCYDEPAFKSNFSIKLTHSSEYTAISNMPVQQLQNNGSLTTTSFYPTLPMCTYLVAFVISDFECITDEHRNVTQRIFTPPNSVNRGELALKNAVHTIAALEDFFHIKYPLKKLDHVALKKNYGSAMENWGLITYKEDDLIYSASADTHKRLKDTLTQSHEIVHQWFGNLVSPEWWTYAWINEGFATYFSYVITDLLHPEDKVMEFFVTDSAERAYSYNFMAVRPMTHYVEKASEIMSVFDIITYQRAACVIKMFHHAFNQELFVRGINRFLRKYQYTVVNELQLFDTLQEELQESALFKNQSWTGSVRDIMLSWTHSKWIPIVSVTRNYESNTITFRQRSKDLISYENWWIPLNFATSLKPDFEHTQADYFMPPFSEITLTLEQLGLQLSDRDWLIVNKQQTGFYHVLYDIENLRAIARQLQTNHTVIHPMNRAIIFQDLTTQIEHNEIESIDVVFEILKYLEYEENLLPWYFVFDTIQFLDRNLFGTNSHALYKQFIRRIIGPTFHRLFSGPEPNNLTNSDMQARQKIIEMACMVDLEECLTYTHQLAHKFIFQNFKLYSDSDYYPLYDTVLCLGVKYLSDKEFSEVLSLLSKSERNPYFYDDLIYSLRCTQDRSHLRNFLDVLVGENSTHIIMNDKESMMYLLYLFKSNLIARPVVWHFFERNFKLLCRSPFFAENFNRIAQYIPQQNRPDFILLHHKIAKELESISKDAATQLISIDSTLFGRKVRPIEVFLKNFEQQIHNWLLLENPPVSYASMLDARNNSNRPTNILHLTRKLLRKILPIKL